MKKHLHNSCYIFLILCVLVSFFPQETKAQSVIFGNEKRHFDIGINIGPSFFLGDLGGHRGKGTRFVKDLNLPLTEFMAGAFVGYYPNKWVGFRVAAQYGKISGEDNVITTKGEDELYRKQRNLDFRSNIFEAYVAAEFYPFMYLNRYDPDYSPRITPYLVGGLGYFHFNPQGSLTDANGQKKWYYLRPLHTEGQGLPEYPNRKEYSLDQINVPMGIGLKYFVSERINISLEVLLRKSFTDYIDDVSTEYVDPKIFDEHLSVKDAKIARQISDKVFAIVNPGLMRNSPGTQRGNPNQNDSYFTTFLKFGIRLGPTYGRSVSSQLKCPIRF